MKKKIYTVLTIVMCFLVLFYIYEIIEINYIFWSFNHGGIGIYAEDIDILGILCAIGAGIGGYFLSKVWWRIVYIEKRHRRNAFKK